MQFDSLIIVIIQRSSLFFLLSSVGAYSTAVIISSLKNMRLQSFISCDAEGCCCYLSFESKRVLTKRKGKEK